MQGYCKSQEIPGGMKMGKAETNKKRKKNALFQTAYELFTDKGFAKTTISDIVNKQVLQKEHSIYISRTSTICGTG